MIVHNGVVVCSGSETLNCMDKPGYQAAFGRTETGYEQTPDNLPSISEDM
jgi:hypothetical protein